MLKTLKVHGWMHLHDMAVTFVRGTTSVASYYFSQGHHLNVRLSLMTAFQKRVGGGLWDLLFLAPFMS